MTPPGGLSTQLEGVSPPPDEDEDEDEEALESVDDEEDEDEEALELVDDEEDEERRRVTASSPAQAAPGAVPFRGVSPWWPLGRIGDLRRRKRSGVE
jgi:hypothetical protein